MWQDTVMGDGDIESVCIGTLLPRQTYISPLEFKAGLAVANAQAKVTWDKAIREVVEWVVNDTRNFEVPLSLGLIVKLKEWGYEVEVR